MQSLATMPRRSQRVRAISVCRRAPLLACILIGTALPHTAQAAQCKVDGEWYDYDSPECQQGRSGSDSAASDTPSAPDGIPAALREIQAYDLVEDAAASRDGDTVSLIVIANAAINEPYAHELGESFLRLYMTFAPDEPRSPGNPIGQTELDYLIQIRDRWGNILKTGAKVAPAQQITW